MKYTVLIPAYNAHNSIDILLNRIENLPRKPKRVIIVDDGSNPALTPKESFKDIYILRLVKNQGKGAALKAGFQHFLDFESTSWLICMDADLQHEPESIDLFLNYVEKFPETDVVIGQREISFGKMPMMRVLSNKITSYIISLIAGKKIGDSQCGYRMLNRASISNLDCKENGYQFESEFILKSRHKKISFGFVPINTIYTNHGSSIHHIKDTLKFIRLIFSEVFK